MLAALDQPIADQALVALHALAGFARREVTVAVGGEGADELFGGYPRYRWLARAERIGTFLRPQTAAFAAGALRRFSSNGRASRLAAVLEPRSTVERHLDWVTSGRRHLRQRLYGPELRQVLATDGTLAGLDARLDKTGDAVARHMVLDQTHWLVDDVLAKADRASMLASLELRTPFLHRELAEFAATVPAEVHTRGRGKALVRAVLSDVLPGSRRPRSKIAFRVPAGDWLRGVLAPVLNEQVETGLMFERGYFDRDAVRTLAREHVSGERDRTDILWPLLCLGLWFDAHGAAVSAELRTLVVTPDFPPATGGIQTLLHRVLRHAQRLHPYIVTLDAPGAQAFDSTQPFAVRRVPVGRAGRQVAVGRLNVAAVLEGLRFRPKVVLSGHVVVSPAAAAIAHALNVPTVQYLYGLELSTRPRLASFALRQCTAAIVLSHHTRDLALAAGAVSDRTHLVPPGVDRAKEDSVHRRNDAHIVLTVSRLDERYKGHDVMMRALPLIAARVPEVRWVVVGDGPLRGELEGLAAVNNVKDRVRFTGRVTDAERDMWFKRARIFAMPSRLSASGGGEGFGIVFLEANSWGLPVVAGAVGGALDAVVDGETGVLVDPSDHVAVAEAVTALLLDDQRADALGQQGAARARAQFSWPTIAARVEAVLLSLCPEAR